MAKSTTPKKGATKKVALKEEIAQVIPTAESPVNPEPKKVKRVSIAKPKALIEKNAKSETVIEVKEQIVEKSSKTPKRSPKKSVPKSEPEHNNEKAELPQKQVKSKGSVSRKSKNKQVDETVPTPGISQKNDIPEGNTLLEQSVLGDDSQSIDDEGFSESSTDSLLKGE
jgi:hypothetical protein